VRSYVFACTPRPLDRQKTSSVCGSATFSTENQIWQMTWRRLRKSPGEMRQTTKHHEAQKRHWNDRMEKQKSMVV
jgi:hypothetical protein